MKNAFRSWHRDVKVVSVKGSLTDHYNPMKKQSTSVVFTTSAFAAAAVAARVWSSVQHAQEWLNAIAIGASGGIQPIHVGHHYWSRYV